MIKTTFVYDEDSLTSFFTFHLKRKDKIRWIYYSLSLLFLLIGVIIVLFFNNLFFGLIMLVSSTIMFMLFPSQAKRAAKRTSNSRYKRGPQDIIFSEERIEQHVDKKIYVYKWDLVLEVNETSGYIYFYVSKQSAIIVNKECITNDEYQELIKLIKEKQLKYYVYK